MHRTTLASTAAALVLLAAGVAIAAGLELDPDLPTYTKVEGLRGTLNAAGSDTMLELQTLMAEDFRKLYPQVKIQVEGKGSSTAPPALIEGTVQLGNMSRAMKDQEVDAFEEKFGYPPTRFDVALDTLAVFVNKDNPIVSLTVPQVDAVFSKTRKCGLATNLSTWGQLGLAGSWATAPISLYGRNAASGTYGYFKDHALCKGDFKDTVKEQPGSASVVQGIEKDLSGIGYSGIGYITSGVRAVPIAPAEGQPPVAASAENAADGSYPLARFLNVYVNKAPGQPLDRLTAEYLRFILSADGQRVVAKAGFDPLDATVVAVELAKLED
ncbi:MAG TPA: PstS family phosphate ABC transporter substrate-binding protein [Thermoanaerobaculales bacterium]|nr:PstS family phosphate ABC transporter substrate-binding protein [Thermoanaerobaculales bacterium]HPA79226.1 PstS family phosphate ABC transporter substrate-binding protein [Thermoanaerobaculales bacterium]HQL28728.1 PstS family phosphate ABC transporter substrate-binding protein [Thermoanaerobaculales bacterium]HQN96778.1 PstS family phosphate ABC transporter substrate-binding protein [Thermoanaerobaculales bacterium]HQP42760.1 PstS family phosphate ABC transporter substrate-binding protein 